MPAQGFQFRKVFAGFFGKPRGNRGVAAEVENGQAARGQLRVRRQAGDGGGGLGNGGFKVAVVAQQGLRGLGMFKFGGEFGNPLAAGGDGSNDRDAELFGERRDVDDDASRRRLVVHVERQHHRHAEFGEQGGQGQGAAQVLGVAHLHQAVGVFVEQGAHRRPFIVAARRE